MPNIGNKWIENSKGQSINNNKKIKQKEEEKIKPEIKEHKNLNEMLKKIIAILFDLISNIKEKL